MSATTNEIQENLAYVRRTVEGHPSSELPLSTAAIVSAFALVGLTWLDFEPRAGGLFLAFGAPVATLAAWFSARRAHWRMGTLSEASSRTHLMHWGTILLVVAAFIAMAAGGSIGGKAMGQAILIGVGAVHVLGGVHFRTRVLLLTGLAAIIGAPLVSYVDRWGWTTIGVVVAVSLMSAALAKPPTHDA